ncbi:MAG: hypothetical protein AAF799_21465 [Myxococcota bacterium]
MGDVVTRWALGLTLVAAVGGCDDVEDASVPAPDYDAFERDVYPILLRDCGFPACHGNEGRPFRVYGPGRLRLSEESEADDPPTNDEVWLSYQRTRSMLVTSEPIEASLLLRKVLPEGGHRGVDALGRSVYPDALDESYLILARWAAGELRYGDQ